MPTIQVEQGSEEWKTLRRSHITATDISVIMGTNPFKTMAQLYDEKMELSPPQQPNEAMKRGTLLEPEARALACQVLDVDFRPEVIISDRYPWAMASLDGIGNQIQSCGIILEIKCPNPMVHKRALDGYIADYYLDQMQWQMLVSDTDHGYYFSYCPKNKEKPTVYYNIVANDIRQEEMIQKGYEFYQRMINFDRPEEWKLNLRQAV